MPAKKYVAIISGRLKEEAALVVSAGAGSDGRIPALDAAGKLDLTVMPAGIGANTVAVLASEALAANDLVNIYNNTGVANVRKADAATEGKEANGFVKSAFAGAATATVYTSGNHITGLTGLTTGRVYLSATAGLITGTPPASSGNVVQCIGTAIGATTVAFEPEEPITLA